MQIVAINILPEDLLDAVCIRECACGGHFRLTY